MRVATVAVTEDSAAHARESPLKPGATTVIVGTLEAVADGLKRKQSADTEKVWYEDSQNGSVTAS